MRVHIRALYMPDIPNTYRVGGWVYSIALCPSDFQTYLFAIGSFLALSPLKSVGAGLELNVAT